MTQTTLHQHGPPSGRSEDLGHLLTYRFLRIALIGLLLGLFVALVLQTIAQGGFLTSISAYYFTPAQAVFVGVLVAAGVSMIVLEGTTAVEDALLNLAGVLAPVVALVPTARVRDFRAVVEACESGSATDLGVPAESCPELVQLRAAIEANVANNVAAYLVVGLVAVGCALWLHRAARPGPSPGRGYRVRTWGLRVIAVVLVIGSLVFLLARSTFVDAAHLTAAIGMFLAIIGVALVNALRHQEVRFDTLDRPSRLAAASRALFSFDRYSLVALSMTASAVVGGVLIYRGTFEGTVFWLETVLLAQFLAFWVVQTGEQWPERAGTPAGR